MIRFPGRKGGAPAEAAAGTMLTSAFMMGMVFALPPMGIFLGVYSGTGSLAAGAALGFGAHFATLAFAGRISELLARAMS